MNRAYTLNGTDLTFSSETGALLSLMNPVCGEIIRGGKGLVDIAWPVSYAYEILRCDPCAKYHPCRPEFIFDGTEIHIVYAYLPQNTITPELPVVLKSGESVILDFGCHNVGYLNFSLNHLPEHITDSPVNLKFTFGEFPLEITTPPESYNGSLGRCWLQNEDKTVVFTPYTGVLERRYSFRYLKIERTDDAVFPIAITDIFSDSVSCVDVDDVKPVKIDDPRLRKIYDICLETLKECEQDVFEDGPKRDRRLWIGDLRLQALTDYYTFNNTDLIKRCIYLFAAYRTDKGFVAPCVFPDSGPYVDQWIFADYSLFIISCLYDYTVHTNDMTLADELYSVAEDQINLIKDNFRDTLGNANNTCFIDWCQDLDKSVAAVGLYIYTLKHFIKLSEMLGKSCDFAVSEIEKAKKLILSYYSKEEGLFIAMSGQISWHSQVWAALAGVFSQEDTVKLLENTELKKPEYIMHTPYMMHYYIEALFNCGLKDKAMSFIMDYWGKIVDYGFDCCPEVFNPQNHLESPYNAPEINSACHAWSCTPAYWIRKYNM